MAGSTLTDGTVRVGGADLASIDTATSATSTSVSPFERFSDADVADLIREYPLAWLCPRNAASAAPSLLPLLAETDDEGHLVALIGHMARRNPLVAGFSGDQAALILFTGPQAYVSHAQVSDPSWAPTWNYAQLRIEATILFQPEGGDEALRLLVEAMERDQPTGWSAAQLGERYRPMERSIIAFRAEVTSVNGRFKLGQDETPARLKEIVARHPDAALVRWMRRFNPRRC